MRGVRSRFRQSRGYRDLYPDRRQRRHRDRDLRRGALTRTTENPLRLEIIVPVIVSCALLWWVSRGMSWTRRLVAAAVTLVVIICVLLFERSGIWSPPG